MIECEQALQDFIVGQHACIEIGLPAVGGRDGLIEVSVGVVEPRGALIVEIGQCADFQNLGGPLVYRQGSIWKTRHNFWCALCGVCRVQPVFAKFVQPCSSCGDQLRAWVFDTVCSWYVRRESFWEALAKQHRIFLILTESLKRLFTNFRY